MAYHALNALNPEAKKGIDIGSFMISSNQMYIKRILNLIIRTIEDSTLNKILNLLLQFPQ